MSSRAPYVCNARGNQNKKIDPLGTGVTDGCEPSSRCWELNPSPLKEIQAFLTAELSHQPPVSELHTCAFIEFNMPATWRLLSYCRVHPSCGRGETMAWEVAADLWRLMPRMRLPGYSKALF